jgi:hypothetical protein
VRTVFAISTFCLALVIRAASASEHEFRYKAPDAQSVSLMGEFNNWKGAAMTKESDGVWSLKVTLSPGTYGYKFLINGKDWVFDPENSNRKTVDSNENSAVAIADDAVTATAPTVAPIAFVAATPGGAVSHSPTPRSTLTSATAANVPPLTPTPGEIFTVELPLSVKRKADAVQDGNANLVHTKMAIAVPNGFDPQKSWPVLVICNTEGYSNIDAMNMYKQSAFDEGWVIMAADDVEAQKDKEGATREACAGAAFDYLSAAWPASKNWATACGGMSGGGKNSAFLAAYLAKDGRRVIGMLMMGVNQDMASVANGRSHPIGFQQVPVFLSSGKKDTIATPAQHESVKTSLRGGGFYKVRLESHDGAHEVYPPHVNEALRWFMAQASTTKAAPGSSSSSDFDKFFKKKP